MCSQIYADDENARTNTTPNSCYNILGSWMPIDLHLFMFVDEIGKNGMLVRKIRTYEPPTELYATKAGLFPKSPYSNTSFVEHVLNAKKSHFISASTLFPDGAPNFSGGKKIYIDIDEAIRHGSRIISSEEIISGLRLYAKEHPHTEQRVNKLINAIQHIEKEVLIEPPRGKGVYSGAIWRPEIYDKMIKLNKVAKVVQLFGFAFTAYDLGNATVKSFQEQSVAPLTAEAVRQAGGWGAAWLGFKIGGVAGATCTLETGPGAAIGGLIGGIIFGFAGYWGADWVADFIYED